MNEKTIKQLSKLAQAMEGGAVQPDELKKVIEFVLGLITELKARLEEKMKEGDSISIQQCQAMMRDINNLQKSIANISKYDAEEAIKRISSEIKSLRNSIPSMPDLSVYEAKLSKIEASIPVIKDTILDNPLQIRDKLESIKTESEKLDIDAIGYLRDELNKLEKKIGKAKGITIFGGGNSSGGRIVKGYDLSDQLNGVLKTFTLPAFWRIISIHSTSFPFVFRPTVDYTVDASLMTITFTSEIDAGSTLNTGQTLTIIYSE